MFIDPAVSAGVAAVFTIGGVVIIRAGEYAGQNTMILVAIATGLGMLALIGGLAQLDANGSAVSRADAHPDYGTSWRPAGQSQPER